MNLRRIKHMLLRLSAEEKVAALGALLVLASSFMPWYSVVMTFDQKRITQNGFSGDLGVIGFVIFLMSLIALLVLIAEHLHIRLPQLGYKKEQVLFFLMGQSGFLVLLIIAVYLKRSLEFTQAELRFGIFLALAGGLFGSFAIFALGQKIKENETKALFGYEPDSPETLNEVQEDEYAQEIYEPPRPEEEPRPSLFTPPSLPPEPDSEPSPSIDPSVPPLSEEERKAQANFFTREAGLR